MNKTLSKSHNIIGLIGIVWIFALGTVAQTTSITGSNSSTNETAAINDANIAAIVTVADGLDIEYGKIALSKSKNQKVREFAQRMVTDHSAVQKAVEELAAKLNLIPEENDTSRGLASNGVKVIAKLNSLSGKDFDKYYVDNEVAYHDLVVNAVKNLLIPNATNPELKKALEGALPLFQRHLEHARMIQKSINKKK